MCCQAIRDRFQPLARIRIPEHINRTASFGGAMPADHGPGLDPTRIFQLFVNRRNGRFAIHPLPFFPKSASDGNLLQRNRRSSVGGFSYHGLSPY